MKRSTPRQEIERLKQLNMNDGFYGTHNQFIILIENRIHEKTTKIMNNLNNGFLWSNERFVHNTIYNYLLDGLSVKEIKNKFKT
jgi:hypothetical protein